MVVMVMQDRLLLVKTHTLLHNLHQLQKLPRNGDIQPLFKISHVSLNATLPVTWAVYPGVMNLCRLNLILSSNIWYNSTDKDTGLLVLNLQSMVQRVKILFMAGVPKVDMYIKRYVRMQIEHVDPCWQSLCRRLLNVLYRMNSLTSSWKDSRQIHMWHTMLPIAR